MMKRTIQYCQPQGDGRQLTLHSAHTVWEQHEICSTMFYKNQTFQMFITFFLFIGKLENISKIMLGLLKILNKNSFHVTVYFKGLSK